MLSSIKSGLCSPNLVHYILFIHTTSLCLLLDEKRIVTKTKTAAKLRPKVKRPENKKKVVNSGSVSLPVRNFGPVRPPPNRGPHVASPWSLLPLPWTVASAAGMGFSAVAIANQLLFCCRSAVSTTS